MSFHTARVMTGGVGNLRATSDLPQTTELHGALQHFAFVPKALNRLGDSQLPGGLGREHCPWGEIVGSGRDALS
jgi:hypothetical protein